ncbi:hypothetical protein C9413_28860 [Rhizobium sp. SEMIA 4085]|nr:hypothetical protein [Rhizobium sp. SEMIA 4085]
MFGTKLRALLQRRKNRDLFDLHEGWRELSLDAGRLVAAFEHYLSLEENVISRANAEQRMLEKLTKSLTEDIAPLASARRRIHGRRCDSCVRRHLDPCLTAVQR